MENKSLTNSSYISSSMTWCHQRTLFLTPMDLKEFLIVPLVLSFGFLSCYSVIDGTFIFKSPHEVLLHEMSSLHGMANVEYGLLDDSRRLTLEDLDQVGSLRTYPRVVNVDDYGAKGDGTDDTEAFQKAWEEVCSSPSTVFLVPRRQKYLLRPIIFSGPCKSDVTVKIKGTLEASSNRSNWKVVNARHWILFERITNLVVEGGGTINGRGEVWWQNSCKINESMPCTKAPTALAFYACHKLKVEKIKIKDSQQIHMSFENCINVRASQLTIISPERSPNTDGIHVAGTKNMVITDCIIRTGMESGDDCISIVTGSEGITVTNIICGPGHGISIGSLGANNSAGHVSGVMVDRALLHGTANGVRIKTWQGGHGHVKEIIFQNIVMHNVRNPIIIDQSYCDSKDPCHEQMSAVKISSVIYRNIRGTSASEVAIKFNCSRSFPCRQITMQDISLVGEDGETTKSLCKHIEWTKEGKVVPPPCN